MSRSTHNTAPRHNRRVKAITTASSLGVIAAIGVLGQVWNNYHDDAAEAVSPDPGKIIRTIGSEALTNPAAAQDTIAKTGKITLTLKSDTIAGRIEEMHDAIHARPQTTDDPELAKNIADAFAGEADMNDIPIDPKLRKDYAQGLDQNNSADRRAAKFNHITDTLDSYLGELVANTGALQVVDPDQPR